MKKTRKKQNYRFSLLVFLLLLFFLMTEFATARSITAGGILFLFAFAQAGLIIWDYMHIGRLFSGRKAGETEEEQT